MKKNWWNSTSGRGHHLDHLMHEMKIQEKLLSIAIRSGSHLPPWMRDHCLIAGSLTCIKHCCTTFPFSRKSRSCWGKCSPIFIQKIGSDFVVSELSSPQPSCKILQSYNKKSTSGALFTDFCPLTENPGKFPKSLRFDFHHLQVTGNNFK